MKSQAKIQTAIILMVLAFVSYIIFNINTTVEAQGSSFDEDNNLSIGYEFLNNDTVSI